MTGIWGKLVWGSGIYGFGEEPSDDVVTDIIGDVADEGIPSEEAFGVGSLIDAIVGTDGIESEEAFGVGSILEDAIIGDPDDDGIDSEETFDDGIVSEAIVGSDGIASAETFDVGSLAITIDADADAGIASAEAFGSPGYLSDLIDGSASDGIASAEAFGVGSLERSIVGVQGIFSEEAFGVGTIIDSGTLPDVPNPIDPVFVLYHAGHSVGACSSGNQLYGQKIGSITISEQINFNSTASYEIYEDEPDHLPAVGLDVQIYVFDSQQSVSPVWHKRFAGQIDNVQMIPNPQIVGGVIYQISCNNYAQALSRRVLTYNFPAAQFGTVNSIMSYISNNILIQEGITWEPGPDPGSIGDINFNGVKLNEAITTLMNAVNQNWAVDYDRVLRTAENPVAVVAAPFDINETDQTFRALNITQSRGLYRNRQIVKGASTRTSTRVVVEYEIPFGLQGPPYGEAWAYFGTAWNNVTQSFDTVPAQYLYDHRYDNIVERVISIKVDGVEQIFYTVPTTGIAIPDDIPNGWVWWTFAPSMNMVYNIAGMPAGSEPQPGQIVRIEFDRVGELPQPVTLQNDAEIANRKSIEGGSGIYEDVQELSEVTDVETLTSYAQKMLDRFSKMGLEVNYETDLLGLYCGMTQVVNLPGFEIDSVECTIESIQIKDQSGVLPRCTVKVSNAIQQRDAQTAIARLIANMKKNPKGTRQPITFTLARKNHQGPATEEDDLVTGTRMSNDYIVMQDITFSEMSISFITEPVGGLIEIDITADGVSILAERPRYAGGVMTWTQFAGSPKTVPKGALMNIDVLSTGTTTPGRDGTVVLIGWV